jgi:hypothetical protein
MRGWPSTTRAWSPRLSLRRCHTVFTLLAVHACVSGGPNMRHGVLAGATTDVALANASATNVNKSLASGNGGRIGLVSKVSGVSGFGRGDDVGVASERESDEGREQDRGWQQRGLAGENSPMERKAHQTMMRQREARKKRAQVARDQEEGGSAPLTAQRGSVAAEGHEPPPSQHGKYNELLSRYTSLLDRVFPLHSIMVHMPDAKTLRRYD